MRTRALAFATVILAVPSWAQEGDTVVWNEDVRGWEVRVDQSLNNACFMITVYEDGSIVRAQFNPTTDNFDFIIGNSNWKSIEQGKLYDVQVTFGNRSPWTGDAEGQYFGDIPALVLPVPFAEDRADLFIEEFMRMTGVLLEYQDRQIANLRLDGTYAAMQEVMSCQNAMLEGGGAGALSDPFLSRSGPSSDPFQ